MIEKLHEPSAARAFCDDLRRRGATLGFVPTMGALHEGHLELVRRAAAENDAACVSVFVNPLQFGEARDFERYPRDFDGDARLLASTGCTMVFTGTLAGFFPDEIQSDGTLRPGAWRDPGRAALGLEGRFRPGHFAGVATIVARLFEVVQPTRAYFGAKDFQQTLVVSDLARALGAPEIVVCPTSRESSGLARSSRNALLSVSDRERATVIARALRTAQERWSSGSRAPAELRRAMLAVLDVAGVEVEYAEARDPAAWTEHEPPQLDARAVALIAARVGGVRLIDNLRLDEPLPTS
ncbi:MAG: pantoate--beta-alanine ligase [Planctomycetota bacterium]